VPEINIKKANTLTVRLKAFFIDAPLNGLFEVPLMISVIEKQFIK
jgi:hypothetical protein